MIVCAVIIPRVDERTAFSLPTQQHINTATPSLLQEGIELRLFGGQYTIKPTMTDIGTCSPAFFGFGGATLGLVFANLGAAYGMAKAGVRPSREENG